MPAHVEYEDEEPLERVEGGEDVGEDCRVLVDSQKPEHPGQAEEWQQDEGRLHYGPIMHTGKR